MIAGGVAAVLVTTGIVYALVSAPPAAPPGKPTVMSTFYPYHFVVKELGADAIVATTLIPAGVEPHDWEPTPADLVALHESEVFVFNGYLEEDWLPAVLADPPATSPRRVNASAGIAFNLSEDGHTDPHVWLDPAKMASIISNIEAALVLAVPDQAAAIHARATALRADFTALDGRASAGLAVCGIRTIVTAHEAFGYFSARYNLTMVAIQGISPDTEPSAAELAEIAEIVNATGVTVIFTEELLDPQVAQTIADETGATTEELSPLESLEADAAAAGEDFIDVMDENLEKLQDALDCT
jgi:zinc transport system substrate-binding protein